MALRKHKNFMTEDLSAALMLASLSSGTGKRRADSFEVPLKKKQAIGDIDIEKTANAMSTNNKASIASNDDASWVLKPAPYFYYTDRSREEDDDPFTPLTPPGLLPTFPAKVSNIERCGLVLI